MGTKLAHPRIQLIHVVTVAQGPITGAFARLWPAARIVADIMADARARLTFGVSL